MSETDAARLADGSRRGVARPSDDFGAQIQKAANRRAPRSRRATRATRIPIPEASPGDDASEPDVVSEIASPVQAPRCANEIQLELILNTDRLTDFDDAPMIVTGARNKGKRKHLKSVYYDTPERTLWRHGLSLRVRQSGTQIVQTVRAESEEDPLRCGEWEAAVAEMRPDLAMAMPFVPAKLRSALESSELQAVFTADIHRHLRVVDLPSGTVEVAFDRGILKSGHRTRAVSEIELELKRGSTGAIFELAQNLAAHGPVRPSMRSKSARGFDLAFDAPPAVRKPRKLRLDPTIPLDDAFASILRACFRHLLQSLPAAEDGRHPEGIHQLRVSLRRLRSALDLMRGAGPLNGVEALRSEVKWLAQNLSAARDWDIFQTVTLRRVAKSCRSIAGFDILDEAAEKRRAVAYERVRSMLAERRCAAFVIGLGGWIEARGWRTNVAPESLHQLAEPTIEFASRTLAVQYAKVLKRGRHFKSLSAEQRHRLRLAVKKLRYWADFLLPLYGVRKSTKRFSKRLADLQEELGGYNDMVTTATLLAQLGATSPDGLVASAAITGWQAHAMASAEARLRDAWADFGKAKPPWLRGREG